MTRCGHEINIENIPKILDSGESVTKTMHLRASECIECINFDASVSIGVNEVGWGEVKGNFFHHLRYKYGKLTGKNRTHNFG